MKYDNDLISQINKKRELLWHPLESKKFMKEFNPKRIFTDELKADACDVWGNSWWWHFPNGWKVGYYKTDY